MSSPARHRFLFVNRDGEDVEVPSVERLARHFQSGALTEDMLLYDALTREWAPARSHPVCRFILDGGRPDDATPAVVEEPSAGSPGDEAPAASEPAPSAPAPSPGETPQLDPADLLSEISLVAAEPEEDTVREFLDSREREREEDRLSGRERTVELELVNPTLESVTDDPERRRRIAVELHHEKEHAGAGPGVDDGVEADAPASTTDARGGRAGTRSNPGSPPTAEDRATDEGSPAPSSVHTDRPAGARRRSLARSAASASGRAILRQAALFVLLLGVGGWGIADAWSAPIPPASPDEARIPATPPRPPGPLAARTVSFVPVDASRELAANMAELQARMSVGEPPAVWMAGPYMGNAGDYPEVARYWERYLDFVSRVRDEEQEMYRRGLRSRLEAQGIYGEAQEIRIARAMQDFRGDAARREAHYADMERLADAALALHAFLVDRAYEIRYEPVEMGVVGDPVLETVVPNPGTRRLLEEHVDFLLESLDAVAGPDPNRRRDVTRHVLGRVAAGSGATAD